MLTTLAIIGCYVLHAFAHVLRLIDRKKQSPCVEKVADLADKAADEIDVIAPSGAAAAAKVIVPMVALWLVSVALLLGAIGLSACAGTDLPVPTFDDVDIGEVYHCRWNDGITRTEDNECLTHDSAIERTTTWKRECQAAHPDPYWFCDCECKWSGFPDLCAIHNGGAA